MVREALDLRGGQLRGLDRAGLDGVEEGGRAIFAGDESGEGGFLGGGWVVGPRADQRGGDLGDGVLREGLNRGGLDRGGLAGGETRHERLARLSVGRDIEEFDGCGRDALGVSK